MKNLLFTFGIIASLILPGYAEKNNNFQNEMTDQNPLQGFWIEPALGTSSLGTSGGVRAAAHLKNNMEISAGFLSHEEFLVFGDQPDKAAELFLALGAGKQFGFAYFFSNVGIGVVNGERKGESYQTGPCGLENLFTLKSCVEYEMDSFSSVGVPLEFGVSVGKGIGMGIKFHGFFGEETLTGVQFFLPLGGYNISR